MRKISFLVPTLALSLTLGSCGLLPGGGDDAVTDPQAGAPAPVPAPAPAPVDPAAAGEGSDLLTASGTSSVFIPATDPDARRQATAEGRTDPFADFPFQPQVTFAPEPPPAPTPQQNVPNVPAVNGGGGSAAAGNNAGGATAAKAGTLPNPNVALVRSSIAPTSARLDFTPVLPQLPTADLAEDTIVTGVIKLNGVDNILVQAPNEEYSRYVQVGDTIANGQVRVKRVDFRRNSPIVVLEQYGIEVYKEIDDVLLADRNAKPKAEAPAEEG